MAEPIASPYVELQFCCGVALCLGKSVLPSGLCRTMAPSWRPCARLLVEFARSINRVRSLAQRHEMRTSQAGARPMTDREVVIQAIEEAQRILAEYIGPRRRGAVATVKALLDVLDVLDRREVVAALNRLKAGYGLYAVK